MLVIIWRGDMVDVGAGRGTAGGCISSATAAAAPSGTGSNPGAAVPRDAQHHLAERVQRASCSSDTYSSNDRKQEKGDTCQHVLHVLVIAIQLPGAQSPEV